LADRAATQKLTAASGTSAKASATASARAIPVVGMMLIQASHSSSAPVTVAGMTVSGDRRCSASPVAASASSSHTSSPVQASGR
jgi:hypothetical protein